MRIEEKILIDEIRKKNRAVFEKLFDEYYVMMVRFAEGFLFDLPASEDVVQNFFIRFWSDARHMDVDTSLKSYFFKCIQNLCLNQLRDNKVYDKHKLLFIEALNNTNNSEPTYDSDIQMRIQKAIEKLPAKMAEIFRLKYLEGKQILDIAFDLNISTGTVKTQLFRGREMMRSMLQ